MKGTQSSILAEHLPSREMPWTRYYRNHASAETLAALTRKTVYQYLVDNNSQRKSALALEFFGARISYQKLFDRIDQTAKAFSSAGVRSGDFVTICSAGTPEIVYTFYALSKLGAVSNMMAPYFNHADMIDRIRDCRSKILIVMDKFYPLIRDVIQSAGIETLILLPTMNASPLSLISKRMKPDLPHVTWNQFVRSGKGQPDRTAVPYTPSQPLAMVYSSGTTGSSKGILLSNDSFQQSVCAYINSGVDLSPGQKFYQLVPTWFSTGISTSVNLPLACGISVFMDPRFEKDVFVKNLCKAKPNYVAAPTSMYEGLLNPDHIKNQDFSQLHYPFEGGEPLKKETANAINQVLREHGCTASLLVGYGQCECGAGAATQTPCTPLNNGSVGIPLPGIRIGIFDDQNRELSYGEHGHILINTPCRMLEYYKNPEATAQYFYEDSGGVRWSRTGDMGYLDETGNLFILGRDTDFTLVGDQKIYHFDIENVLMMTEHIIGCEVLPLRIDEIAHIAAHLIFDAALSEDPSFEARLPEILRGIQTQILKVTQNPDAVPHYFKIRKDFPVAASGKRDTAAIARETEGFLSVPCSASAEN